MTAIFRPEDQLSVALQHIWRPRPADAERLCGFLIDHKSEFTRLGLSHRTSKAGASPVRIRADGGHSQRRDGSHDAGHICDQHWLVRYIERAPVVANTPPGCAGTPATSLDLARSP